MKTIGRILFALVAFFALLVAADASRAFIRSNSRKYMASEDINEND